MRYLQEERLRVNFHHPAKPLMGRRSQQEPQNQLYWPDEEHAAESFLPIHIPTTRSRTITTAAGARTATSAKTRSLPFPVPSRATSLGMMTDEEKKLQRIEDIKELLS